MTGLWLREPSSRHYARCRLLYRSLKLYDIRWSRELSALRRLERLLVEEKRGSASVHGLDREMSRSELGAMLVETRNRIDALTSGRADRPRPKGPRLDPSRLPDAALNRLIQQHHDLAVVETLRAERARRSQEKSR